MRKSEKVKLFGKELTLTERNAGDVLSLIEFASSDEGKHPSAMLYILAYVVHSALKNNLKEPELKYKSIPKWKFLKKKEALKELNKFEAQIEASNLMGELSSLELSDLAEKVYIMEGLDIKKKVTAESELIET